MIHYVYALAGGVVFLSLTVSLICVVFLCCCYVYARRGKPRRRSQTANARTAVPRRTAARTATVSTPPSKARQLSGSGATSRTAVGDWNDRADDESGYRTTDTAFQKGSTPDRHDVGPVDEATPLLV